MMGERKMKIVDVAQQTGVHRNAITLLYKDEAQLIDIEILQKLCELFNCSVGELLEFDPKIK